MSATQLPSIGGGFGATHAGDAQHPEQPAAFAFDAESEVSAFAHWEDGKLQRSFSAAAIARIVRPGMMAWSST